MTPEQKREQLLKRILPGMAITVIYFVFISGLMSEKMHKAEEDYQSKLRSGVSAASLPGVMSQSTQIQQQIAELKRKQSEYRDKLKALAGFLSNSTPSNDSTELLSGILDGNGMRIVEEKREAYPEKDLNASLQEVWHWLKPPEAKESKANSEEAVVYVEHLWLRGSFRSMYAAMAAIAGSDLKAAPVLFTMHTPEIESGVPDELEWELVLWM
ncbi:MAG: hypothetical protein ACU85E_03785 [Gammaproteobacteria bacterium]